MKENEFTVVYAAAYDSMSDARADYEAIKELHKDKWIGKYESALFSKNEDGSLKIHDTDATSRGRGLKLGTAIGAAVGLIFPVTLLAGAAVGAGAGLLGGHLSKALSREDIKELGELLDKGEAGIVLIGVATPEEGLERYLQRASKVMKKQVDADAEEVKRQIDESVREASRV
jgi:uncharacterized membrane protein